MMKKDSEEYLLQTDLRGMFAANLEAANWTPAYLNFRDDGQNGGFFAAFVPSGKAPTLLKDFGWDISKGDCRPSVWTRTENGKDIAEYHHYTEPGQIQPIVLDRTFNGIKPSCCEIQEEFRLYHNLYYDHANSKYIKIHDDGNEEDIVLVEKDNIMIRTKALRQFAAIKEMAIVLFVDSVRFSPIPLSAIKEPERYTEGRTEAFTYFVRVSDNDFSKTPAKQSFSRFLGKRIIAPLPVEKSGIWPYDQEPKQFESFIIGADRNGEPTEYTSDPDKLANYFGANPDAPNYLTPVFFRKEVLNKYYAQPDKYEVTDGHLCCGGLWGLRMDNDHSRQVVVYLGDLGKDLSYDEQKYWRTFNILPEGGVSKTCYMRSIRGWFVDPETPDLCFKHELSRFNEEWKKTRGWALFLDLSAADQHFLTALHLPTTNEQAEFDQQVLALTKVLIDSLNEAELARQCKALPDGAKGIDKLEAYLKQAGNASVGSIVGFLRDLQALRSSGVGHRKGERYEKVSARFGIGTKCLQNVFHAVLFDAIAALQTLLGNAANSGTPEGTEKQAD